MADLLPLVPAIMDEDIKWVRGLMRLNVLDEPRRAFLAACSTLDVSACPGSGKTTLVVAKLAILARKWPHRTKGVCVLSHTNVAREEIQCRLGTTVVGQRLLGHPHFIDTIHGFVNRFLALPWLRSKGFPSPTIGNDVTTAYRRGVLGRDFWALQTFLKKKDSSFDRLRICARDLSFDLGGKVFPAGPGTTSFRLAKRATEAAAQAGYFCHDEMFVWARALLEDFPEVASWLRRRFPLVIIDEMQDTFDIQGAMLHAVFPRTSPDIVVQRVGDPNQAIFDYEAELNRSDPFPDPASTSCLDIPNSHRFGPGIAALASPFAVTPVGAGGLCSIGPKAIAGTSATCPHAIFIFPDDDPTGVLDAYGKHVLTVFDDSALARGTVTAVGAVHQDASDVTPGHMQFPKSVPHYWPGYSAEISGKEPHPKSLIQYVRAAQAAVQDGWDLGPGVEKMASGLVRLASRIGDVSRLRRKMRTHRAIVDLLELKRDTTILSTYRRLVTALLIDSTPLTQANWSAMQSDILAVACALCDGAHDPTSGIGFLAWPADDLSLTCGSPTSPKIAGPNVYCVVDGDRYLDIRLGSIHSVKGQTHLATMVLSTYWHAHSFKRLLPWLVGQKSNGKGAGVQDVKRLRQTYVAMTRPSHLICFAAPQSALGVDSTQHLATLQSRGWRLAEMIGGIARWHDSHNPRGNRLK